MRIVALLGAIVTTGVQQVAPPAVPLPIEQRVDQVIRQQMANRHIPGLSLGVVRDGQLVLAKGYGDATLEWKQPATPDTVYLLASVTKQFTATAVMMLAGDGRVRLDEAIDKYVDAPAQWAGITVRHLLTHTAGLKDRFEGAPDGRMYLDYSTKQMFDAAAHTPVDAAPGALWQYSDQGYFLLGMVVEKASPSYFDPGDPGRSPSAHAVRMSQLRKSSSVVSRSASTRSPNDFARQVYRMRQRAATGRNPDATGIGRERVSVVV